MEFYSCVETVSFFAVFIIGRCPRAWIVLKVFLSKQCHFSANNLIVNPIEYGVDLGVLFHILTCNRSPLLKMLHYLIFYSAFVVNEQWMLAWDFWRTFPLLPGYCLDLKWSIRMANPDSLACVFHCGDALCVFKFRLAHLQIHYHQSILLAPFFALILLIAIQLWTWTTGSWYKLSL